jgi:hypothetical protein
VPLVYGSPSSNTLASCRSGSYPVSNRGPFESCYPLTRDISITIVPIDNTIAAAKSKESPVIHITCASVFAFQVDMHTGSLKLLDSGTMPKTGIRGRGLAVAVCPYESVLMSLKDVYLGGYQRRAPCCISGSPLRYLLSQCTPTALSSSASCFCLALWTTLPPARDSRRLCPNCVLQLARASRVSK